MNAERKPARGEVLELEVDKLAYGGSGVARTASGYVVFVSGALPGDRVRAAVTTAKKAFAEANAVEIVRPSADRVPTRCDHGGEPCPGAPWQGLAYEKQLAVKTEQVADALTRIAHLSAFDLEPIEPARETWRYRNKFEYAFGTRDGQLVLGFHARGRWHDVVDAVDCMLASEPNNTERNRIRDWARARGLAAYDRRAKAGTLRNLVVREGRRTGQLQTRLVASPGPLPEPPPVDLLTFVDRDTSGTLGPTEVLRNKYLEETLGDLRFRISHEAFFQTNTEMAERLYAIAADYAGLTGRERVFDLFCGIGTIALVLARRAGEVWGIEVVERAIADAVENAKLNRIENAQFAAGDVRTSLRDLIARAGHPDVVVVDPPRAGLSSKIVRRVVECKAARIVYVSCNPTTLAPNAAELAEAGYRLRKVRPVDMFPHTPHIECVALFERT